MAPEALVRTLTCGIPPQAYLRVVELFGYSRGYLTFWREFLAFDHRLCAGADCSVLPDMRHMWFVAYFWIYTVILAAILAVMPRALPWLRGADRKIVCRYQSLYKRWVSGKNCLSATRIRTHARMRASALGGLLLGVVAYAMCTSYTRHYQDLPIPFDLKVVMACVYGCEQWTWIVAAAGFAYRHLLTAEGPWRRYLTEAIFRCCIIHQIAIVVFAHEIARLRLPLPVEILMVVVVTALACVAGYELIPRVPWLRPAFGVKPIPAPARAATSRAE